MKRFKGMATAAGGYYFNLRDWKLETIEGATGTLPGDDDARYVRVPLLGMLLLVPVLGLAFVILLPFLGIAVLGEQAWHTAAAAVAARRAATTRPVTIRRQ
jgi:hypothetical protein